MATVNNRTHSVSIVIPAKDEARNLEHLVPELLQLMPDAEVIVVDDGSSDDTAAVATQTGANVIKHPYSMGNGAAIKSGARAARGDIVVCMDADNQHRPEVVPQLLERLQNGYDMVVGQRGRGAQSSSWRGFANWFYNSLAGLIVNHPVGDLTSGFRCMWREKFLEFIHLLPNGFSYPTTITMAFFRAGYAINYLPVEILPNQGRSHIRPLRDGLRFVLIIVKVGTLYSPLKFFVPISAAFFVTGLGYYAYTLISMNRFTNMSALLFTTSIITFLIGLVSEQITTLMYRK